MLCCCPGAHPSTLTRDSNHRFSSGFSFPAGGNAPTASVPFRQEHGHNSHGLGLGLLHQCMEEGEVQGCRCQPVSIEMDSPSSGLPSTWSQAGAVFVGGLRQAPGTGTGSSLFPLLLLTEESARMALAGNSQHHCHLVPPQPLLPGWQGHFCSEIEVPAPGPLLNSALHSDQQQAENQIYLIHKAQVLQMILQSSLEVDGFWPSTAPSCPGPTPAAGCSLPQSPNTAPTASHQHPPFPPACFPSAVKLLACWITFNLCPQCPFMDYNSV